jgi:hypothetical protein
MQGAWAKDDLGWGFAAGTGIGSLISDCYALSTNFGAGASGPASTFTTNRALYDSGVMTKANGCLGAHIDALHWWTDQLRSNLTFGLTHQDSQYALVTGTSCIKTGGNAVPAGTASGAFNNCAAGGNGVNKELDLAVLNLIWSPVSFVDLGVEYAWGHRDTLYNVRGDAFTASGFLKVKF